MSAACALGAILHLLMMGPSVTRGRHAAETSSRLAALMRSLVAMLERSLDYVANRPALALLLPAALYGLLAWLLVGRLWYPLPFVHDEFSYLLGADTFASGRLANPTHPLWHHFETAFVIHVPTYVSMYPPAQAIFLAAGQKFAGHPWYGVVGSGVLLCIAAAWMYRVWLPARWAVLASFFTVHLLIAGWWWELTGYWTSSYWGGSVAAFGGALVLGVLGRVRRHVRVHQGLLFGLGTAVLALSRPYEGLALMLGIGAVLLLLMYRGRFSMAQWLTRFVLPAALVITLSLGWLSFYCYKTTNNPVTMPYVVFLDQYMVRRMFYWGENKPQTYRHLHLASLYQWLLRDDISPKEKVINHAKRLSQFYFGPVLILALLALPWVLRDRRFRPLLVAIGITCAAVAMVEWVHIHYIAPISVALVALLVQCLRHIRTWKLRGVHIGMATVVILIVANLLVNTYRAVPLWDLRRTRGWWVARDRIAETLANTGETHLVVVRYSKETHPLEEWVFNLADIDKQPVVWAREMKDNQRLFEYYKDRKIWLLQPSKHPVKLEQYSPPDDPTP